MVSVWHQSTARAIRKHRIRLLSYRSRGTLMSYTDHSAQRRLKSNAPNVSKQLIHKSFGASQSSASKAPSTTNNFDFIVTTVDIYVYDDFV